MAEHTIGLPRPPVILDILEEHFSELDFLWEQRERWLFSPEWTLKELAAIEERAEAHLDGLRIGGGHSVDIARPFLTDEETGAATAATFVLMAFDSPPLQMEVVHALATAPPQSRDGIRIGLRHSPIDRIAAALDELAVIGPAPVRAAALDVLAFHRLPQPKGVRSLLDHPDVTVRRLACDAVGRFGGPWGRDQVLEALECDSPPLRLAALRASARVGLPHLDQLCRSLVSDTRVTVPETLEFLATFGQLNDLPLIERFLGSVELAPAAVCALGKLGRIAAIPLLLDLIDNTPFAAAAGRAFVRIVGANNVTFRVEPRRDGTEERDQVSQDEPTVDPQNARSWWKSSKHHFTTEGRWQAGKEVSRPIGESFDTLPLDVRLDLFLFARAVDPTVTHDFELERRVYR
jgi:uncharacterized protein (TIGR02270 family)